MYLNSETSVSPRQSVSWNAIKIPWNFQESHYFWNITRIKRGKIRKLMHKMEQIQISRRSRHQMVALPVRGAGNRARALPLAHTAALGPSLDTRILTNTMLPQARTHTSVPAGHTDGNDARSASDQFAASPSSLAVLLALTEHERRLSSSTSMPLLHLSARVFYIYTFYHWDICEELN